MKRFGITGWKNSGKTGLTARLVTEFTRRGLVVSTLKHAHHSAEIDHEETDSFRHREAGAQEVLLVSGARWALMHELRDAPEPPLDAMLERLSPADLVLVEGYKSAPHPKIECHRFETGKALFGRDNPTVRAFASNTHINIDRPCFDLNDTHGIADFITAEVDL